MTRPDPEPGSHQRSRPLLASRLGLARVVNASGTMTSIGASRVVPEAVAAGAEIQGHFVRIDELQAKASTVVARLTGAEAGCVTACSAAGITESVAAAMTGTDLARIEQLPDTTGMKSEVVIQAGHLIDYGAPVEQAVRVAGATVVPAGTAARVEPYHLESRLTGSVAAALYVVSHHTVQEGQVPLEDFVAACRERDVPVIVDMASEYDLRGPIELGADIAIYSAHKFLGGPTAGIIAGSKDLVRACYLQNRGLGRLMKVGKEGILGTIAALEAWEGRDHAGARERERKIVSSWLGSLDGHDGIDLAVVPDWTGNPIDRLRVTVDPVRAKLFAWELADRLAGADPAIVVRDDLIEQGFFFLDPCNLEPEEAQLVSDRILALLDEARTGAAPGCKYTWSERRRRSIESALRWPDG